MATTPFKKWHFNKFHLNRSNPDVCTAVNISFAKQLSVISPCIHLILDNTLSMSGTSSVALTRLLSVSNTPYMSAFRSQSSNLLTTSFSDPITLDHHPFCFTLMTAVTESSALLTIPKRRAVDCVLLFSRYMTRACVVPLTNTRLSSLPGGRPPIMPAITSSLFLRDKCSSTHAVSSPFSCPPCRSRKSWNSGL